MLIVHISDTLRAQILTYRLFRGIASPPRVSVLTCAASLASTAPHSVEKVRDDRWRNKKGNKEGKKEQDVFSCGDYLL